jgi:hypothetical protein
LTLESEAAITAPHFQNVKIKDLTATFLAVKMMGPLFP